MEFRNQKKILENIHNQLFPKVIAYQLILKLAFIQFIGFLFVLSICPQFGFGIFKNGHYGLTSLFMKVSDEFCQIMCGITLFSVSFLALKFNLKITEIEWLRKNKVLMTALVVSLMSQFFWMFAPEIYLEQFILWLIGALVSYIIFFELKHTYSFAQS